MFDTRRKFFVTILERRTILGQSSLELEIAGYRQLHLPDQSARERKLDGAPPRVRSRQRGLQHGRRHGQPRMEAYHAEHESIRLNPEARNARHTYVMPAEDKRSWTVQQVLVDPDEHNDWKAEFQVDLMASRETGEPALRLREISSVAR